MRELSGDFNTSRVKENAPPLSSLVSFCPSVFCAFQVKAKNEKRLTRAYACALVGTLPTNGEGSAVRAP